MDHVSDDIVAFVPTQSRWGFWKASSVPVPIALSTTDALNFSGCSPKGCTMKQAIIIAGLLFALILTVPLGRPQEQTINGPVLTNLLCRNSLKMRAVPHVNRF